MAYLTTKQVLAKVQRETGLQMELFKGEGYWYFTYTIMEDGKVTFYETQSVMVKYLNQLNLDQWVSEAKTFARYVAANVEH